MLPIVQRELQVALRGGKLHKGRHNFATLAALFAMSLVVFSSPGGGGRTFQFLTYLVLLYIVVEALRRCADAISMEKREGTLGFLFLSDLKGHDIVFGKLSASALRTLQGVLSFLPLISITLLLGGVTFGEFARTAVVLLNTLFVTQAFCLAVSSLSRERATLASTIVLFAWMSGSDAIGNILSLLGVDAIADSLISISPTGALRQASDAAYPRARFGFWTGLAIAHGCAWITLSVANYVTARVWQDQETKPEKSARRRSLGPPAERLRKRRILLDENPVLWLAHSERTALVTKVILFLFIFITDGVVFQQDAGLLTGWLTVCLWFLPVIALVGIAAHSSKTLAEARRSGALELMLSTPLTNQQILSGVKRSIWRTFGWPLSIFAGVVLVVLLSHPGDPEMARVTWFAVKALLELVLAAVATTWMGLYFSLSRPSPNSALFRTLFIAVVLPWILVCVPNFVIYLVVLATYKDKVTGELRKLAAAQYSLPLYTRADYKV